MILEYNGSKPLIPDDTYIAPDTIIRGNVVIGKGTCILFGAVITAEGGAVNIGENCVVMEHAVIRGTPRHPLEIGNSVLVGPHSHLSGCRIEEQVFLATGVSVFNGAIIEASCEVRVNAVVHVNTVLKKESVVPIGWVAVGDPAKIFPPDKHDQIWDIQRKLDFPGTVWETDRDVSHGEQIRSYARSLLRQRKDRVIPLHKGDRE